MDYFVNCECGKRIQVALSKAGSEFICKCGRKVRVPILSDLRKQVGEQPFERTPSTVIAAHYPNKQHSVGGGHCLSCAASTDAGLICIIECESPHSQDYPWLVKLFLTMFTIWIQRPLSQNYSEAVGQEKVFEVRVSVCPSCRKRALQIANLRKLLANDPEFAALFREYPLAKVSVMRDRGVN